MRHLLRYLVLVALLLCPALPPSAGAQGQNDHLIVPGQRVGPVYVGMTAAALYQAMGDPQSTDRMVDPMRVIYHWSSIVVEMSVPGASAPAFGFRNRTSDSVVMYVSAVDPTFATRDGVAVGASELSAEARLGSPSNNTTILGGLDGQTPIGYVTCYNSGLIVNSRVNGAVTAITVRPPNGCNSAWAVF